MKIGLSYGRCIRDIVKGLVDIDDVLIVVTKTAIRDREDLPQLVSVYSYEESYLAGLDKGACLSVAEKLWDQGKIYQPRLAHGDIPYGKFLSTGKHGEVWCDLVPSYTGGNSMVEDAYNNYLMVRKLAE